MGIPIKIPFTKYVMTALAAALTLTPAIAETDPLANVLNGPALEQSLDTASGEMQGCTDKMCLAVHDLNLANDAMLRRDLPNTMVHTTPVTTDPRVVADHAIGKAVLIHKDRYDDYCQILTKLAQHYSEWSMGFFAIEMANRIDRKGATCTSKIIASFPPGEETGKLIAYSKEYCQLAGRPNCRYDQRDPE